MILLFGFVGWIMSDNGWWYYMMGRESAKRSGRKLGAGWMIWMAVLVIVFLVMLGILVAVCVWYFAG